MQHGVVGKFDGYPLIEVHHMADKVQVRKHKKKRINKKWLKRYGMKEVPWKTLVLFEGKIYGHPMTLKKLIESISTSPHGDAHTN